ncbi:MAG: 5-formyltetrahydrofolate cyclo-ligase [Candidatus Omnitrophica bacterium]|nr:5-formyltetrahydrofolate cyclo-ligase [Candidatus Omnitrophota bacterium]
MKPKAKFDIIANFGNASRVVKIVTGLTKQQIRSKLLLKLKSQKEEERERKSGLIKDKLFRTQLFQKAKTVMFYLSFDGEVNTKRMIEEALKLGKIVAVPVCGKKRAIKPCVFSERARLKKGPYGVCEPAIKETINLEDLGLVIVPGVAFDKKGNRLGRGKGCYDYFLRKLPRRIPAVALAFDFQILPSIPATKRDICVNKVIFA